MVIYHLYSTYSLYFFFLSYCMDLKISNLIASEIVRNEDINARVSTIEKWVAVADICRCLHNYNAVLEITSSLPSPEHQQGQQVLGTRTAKVRKWLTQGKAQDPANVLSLVPGFICSWVQHTLKAEKQSGFTV